MASTSVFSTLCSPGFAKGTTNFFGLLRKQLSFVQMFVLTIIVLSILDNRPNVTQATIESAAMGSSKQSPKLFLNTVLKERLDCFVQDYQTLSGGSSHTLIRYAFNGVLPPRN